MNSAATVLAVAGDPGGANALLPVLRALREAGVDVVACPYREAVTSWAPAAISTLPLDDSTDPAQLLRQARPSFLLTATSMNGVDLEKRFIVAARSMQIPSLAVLDFWSHYRERFADSSGALAYMPDHIAVMDDLARDEMLRCGFDAARISVTGQPAFDELRGWRRQFSAERRASVRCGLGAGPDDLLIAFLSQPLSETVGNKFGFTEISVLEQVTAALVSIQRRHPEKRLVLVIRPHPREQVGKFEHLVRTELNRLVSGDGDRREVVMAADLVVGMNTVLLYEACLMSCITLSVQPDPQGGDVLPSNRAGWSRAVYNPDNIEPTLEQMLLDEKERAAIWARLAAIVPPQDATSRVVELIQRMVSEGGQGS